jgi:protein ImuB
MTRRVVSVWLTRWRTDRLESGRNPPVQELRDSPLVLIHAGQGGERLVAVNERAALYGLRPGLLLADARAMAPGLRSLPHDAEADARDLQALARWCGGYSPHVSPDPPDGLWLDMSGVTHLFGGEAPFLDTLQARFERMGLASRSAIADTPGAAWACARFGDGSRRNIPPGGQREALVPFPVAALRLAPGTARQLERLGLKRIGQLYDIPPAAFRARFGAEVARRLDQALGREKEPVSPLVPEPGFYAALRFPEPIGMLGDVGAIVDSLAERLASRLARHGKGARGFVLTLYGATGGCFPVEVATSGLVRDAGHIRRLFRERLSVLENRFDPDFGADAFSLQAHAVDRLDYGQNALDGSGGQEADIARLLDRLQARLGRNAVARLALRESHIPERAALALRPGSAKPAKAETPPAPRPLLLLPRPEPIRAIAEVPDYPPHRFEWRRLAYSIVRAEGPERVTAEWWRENTDGDYRTRDYFRVEDPSGARFWIYRLGLMERHEGPVQWFMHGLFA